MADTQQQIAIQAAIHAFTTKSLHDAATALFACLVYKSDRTIAVDSVEAFCHQFDPSDLLAHPRAQKASWKSIELLLQLTDEELSRNATLFKDTAIRASLLQSYVFFAVDLQPRESGRREVAGAHVGSGSDLRRHRGLASEYGRRDHLWGTLCASAAGTQARRCSRAIAVRN